MEPQTPPPAQQPQGSFIDQYQPVGAKSPMQKKQKVLMIIIGVGLILAIIILVLGLVTGGSGTNDEIKIAIAQQQEINRVAEKVIRNDAADQDLKNFASTIRINSASVNKELTDYLSQKGVEVKEEELALFAPDTNIDDDLDSATKANELSDIYYVATKNQLTSANEQLNKIYLDTSNETLKGLLDEAFQSYNRIIEDL